MMHAATRAWAILLHPNTITVDEAFRHCQSLGERLADIDAHNLAPLTAFVNCCLGPSSRIQAQT